MTETTARMIAERRSNTLRELGAHLSANVVNEVWQKAERLLSQATLDFPFFELYVRTPDGRAAKRFREDGVALPDDLILLNDHAPRWPLRDALESPRVVEGLSRVNSTWPEPVDTALVMPIRRPELEPYGFLVAGISPRRRLNPAYHEFVEQ